MSAETLRKAAAEIRRNHDDEFFVAVADWLDAYADRLDTLGHGIGSNMGHALAVARAYLGEDA